MKRIISVHLLNDRSGSPQVLRNSLSCLSSAGYHIDLLTATSDQEAGCLSELPGVVAHALPYRLQPSRWRTLLNFCWVQAVVFAKVLHLAGPGTVVYVNSLLPGGAALAARCRGARVVYHVHEVSLRPALLQRLLCGIVNLTADRVLFVSHFVRQQLALSVPQQAVVHNVLSPDFLNEANAVVPAAQPFRVLMACSLKDYKGVPEFFDLARALPDMAFELVLNAAPAQVASFQASAAAPSNLTLYASTANMHAHYRRASVVVNLSRPAEWVETFGLTILEAMQYGKPVIVPVVGGMAEVNIVGETGFAIDSRDLPALERALHLLQQFPRKYAAMSAACRRRAAEFAPSRFSEQINQQFEAEFARFPLALPPVPARFPGRTIPAPAVG
ncbi:glycosyltransferase [Hymenobacter sp. BT683]|uniref:Glycosyltransferase n=1 Tax=Hymenobacter jeongseonensis TaxID=2791027 RepID=A0ABS0IMS0_9BACT|nr:glycosyltransferase [Hymenobacter jeongseonensis]MBF9239670.1 glycosyltransferase [Hymenobacter jeongseonensis]